jgi:hypothetical protein
VPYLLYKKIGMKKILLLSALCSIGFFACKKKSEDIPTPAPLEDYTFEKYLKQTGFDQTVFETGGSGGADFFERGIVFEPLVAGNLVNILLKFPAAAINTKVILWNATTKQPITSYIFNYSFLDVGTQYPFTIPITALQKNEKYCISFALESNIYKRKRTDAKPVMYPIEFKNLRILSHNSVRLTNINLRKYPTDLETQSYYGDVNFVFQ